MDGLVSRPTPCLTFFGRPSEDALFALHVVIISSIAGGVLRLDIPPGFFSCCAASGLSILGRPFSLATRLRPLRCLQPRRLCSNRPNQKQDNGASKPMSRDEHEDDASSGTNSEDEALLEVLGLTSLGCMALQTAQLQLRAPIATTRYHPHASPSPPGTSRPPPPPPYPPSFPNSTCPPSTSTTRWSSFRVSCPSPPRPCGA